MERQITYKPVIDTSNLPEQLAEIQNQLNQVMGASQFSGVPDKVQPFSNTLGTGGTTVSQVQAFGNSIQAQTSSIFGQMEAASQTMHLGMYKFNDALQVQSLMGPLSSPRLATDQSIDQLVSPNFDEKGMIGGFFGSKGWGYDPNTMGMTRADYRAKSADRMEDIGNRIDFGADAAGAAIGFGVGALLGPWAGIPASMAAEWAIDHSVGAFGKRLYRGSIERDQIADYVRGGSFRFAGGQFSKGASRGIAADLQSLYNSQDFRTGDLTQFQAESLISEFTGAGGFDSVRSAEEYTTKVKQLLDNTQKVAQLLHTSLKDAAITMAKLETTGVTQTPLESLNLISKIESRAGQAGMTSSEFLNLGFQGANMVQGTGIGFNAGFQGIQDMTLALTGSVAAGQLDQNVIRHLGGIQQAAGFLTQNAFNFGSSALGYVYGAAGGMGQGIQGSLQQALGNINAPGDILTLMGNQTQFITDAGAQNLGLAQTAGYLEELTMMMGGQTPTQEQFRGFLIRYKNFSAPQADALVAQLNVDPVEQASRDLSRQREIETGEEKSWFRVGLEYFTKEIPASVGRAYNLLQKQVVGETELNKIALSKDELLRDPTRDRSSADILLKGDYSLESISREMKLRAYNANSRLGFGDREQLEANRLGYNTMAELIMDDPENVRKRFEEKGITDVEAGGHITDMLDTDLMNQDRRWLRDLRSLQGTQRFKLMLTKSLDNTEYFTEAPKDKKQAIAQEQYSDFLSANPNMSVKDMSKQVYSIAKSLLGTDADAGPMMDALMKSLGGSGDENNGLDITQKFMASAVAGDKATNKAVVDPDQAFAGINATVELIKRHEVQDFLTQMNNLANKLAYIVEHR